MGGHPAPFVDDTVTVANGHPLPTVFGSVRAYFDSVSNGAFQLHVRIVNPEAEGTDDLPRWIELPETKEHYAEIIDNWRIEDVFWDAAYDATLDSLSLPDPAWENVRTGISLPHHDSTATYPYTRLLRRKILFLYSGVFFTPDLDATRAGVQHGLLHPQVDYITEENPSLPEEVGYRYVMGERQGWPKASTQPNATLTSSLVLVRTPMKSAICSGLIMAGVLEGSSQPVQRRATVYQWPRGQPTGWTLMQGGGEQGPRADDPDGYYTAYRSCPNPINPSICGIWVG